MYIYKINKIYRTDTFSCLPKTGLTGKHQTVEVLKYIKLYTIVGWVRSIVRLVVRVSSRIFCLLARLEILFHFGINAE